MSNNEFEQLRLFAKFIGYEHSIEYATKEKGNPLNKTYTLYSKEPIDVTDEYEVDGKKVSVIDKEWSRYYSLEILTGNSFNPSTRWGSLMICNDKMMSYFGTKQVAYFDAECQVKYLDPDQDIKNEKDEKVESITGVGKDEFEATYNAIQGFSAFIDGK
jgi:hypothetical protein